MKRRFRTYLRRIKNIIRWMPVLWRDEQWDYYYIYEVLKHKLTIMAANIRENGNHVTAKYDADRMMLCVKLIGMVQSEYYCTKAFENREITSELVKSSYKQHNKAKRILFKMLDNYIERWWD